jgi:hypothetical protein
MAMTMMTEDNSSSRKTTSRTIDDVEKMKPLNVKIGMPSHFSFIFTH